MKLLKPQILNLNRRNMDMENKNVLILLPCSSPMKKHKHLDQDSLYLKSCDDWLFKNGKRLFIGCER